MTYQEARRLRGTGLLDLAAQNIALGNGVIGSLGSAMSSKFKAKVTGIKESFDPLNIAKKLTGNFGSAVLGRLTGRNKEDIRYFAGGKRFGSSAGVTQDSNLDSIQPALYTRVAEGQRQKMKKGESVTDVMAKLYNLLKRGFDQDQNFRDHDIKDKRDKHKRDLKWHKDLLEAITGKKVTSNISKGIVGGGDMFSKIFDKLKTMLAGSLEKSAEKKLAKEAAEQTAKQLEKEAAEKALKETEKEAAEKALKETVKDTSKLAVEEGATDLAGKVAGGTAKAAIEEKSAQTAVKVVDEKIIETAAKKSVAEMGSKSIFKGVPLAGALIGLGFSIPRIASGDYTGAALEVASGVGGITTSVAGGMIQATRDVYKEVYGNFPEKDPPSVAADRLVQIKNVLQKVAEESFKQRDKNLSSEAPESLQKDIDVNKAAFGYVRPAIRPKSKSTGSTGGSASTTDGSASTSEEGMKNYVSRAPTVTPVPASSPVGQKVQEVINQNNNLQMESLTPKVVKIDNSKNITSTDSSGGSDVFIDGSVPVRTEDNSLQTQQRANLRPI